MVEWLLWNLIRVRRSLQRVLLANASFADLKVWRKSDTSSFYVVPPEDVRMKRKIWSLLKNRRNIRDTSQVFATHTWRKVSTNTVFRKTHWCRGGTGKQR